MSRADSLLTEYEALTSYYGHTVTFRFTTVGLFVAAMAFTADADVGMCTRGVLLVTFSSAAWMIELRNRMIVERIGDVGKTIESDEEFFPASGRSRKEHAMYHRLFPLRSEDGVKISWLWRERQAHRWMSHSAGIDLVFFTVFAYGWVTLIGAFFTSPFGWLAYRLAWRLSVGLWW